MGGKIPECVNQMLCVGGLWGECVCGQWTGKTGTSYNISNLRFVGGSLVQMACLGRSRLSLSQCDAVTCLHISGVCVCVYVCEREREVGRERENKKYSEKERDLGFM